MVRLGKSSTIENLTGGPQNNLFYGVPLKGYFKGYYKDYYKGYYKGYYKVVVYWEVHG